MIVLVVVVVINIVFAIVIHGEQGAKWWVLVEIFYKNIFYLVLFILFSCMYGAWCSAYDRSGARWWMQDAVSDVTLPSATR